MNSLAALRRLTAPRVALGARRALFQSRTSAAMPFTSTRSMSSEELPAGADKVVGVEIGSTYSTHDVDGLPAETSTNREECLEYYEVMYRMRRMEIMCDTEYKQKNIRGFCHLYDGQEAVGMGLKAAVTEQDPLITSYRCHCHQLARGDSVERILAELFGRAGGSVGGKGGSMHFYKPDTNFYGGQGIVGAQVPVGTGLAFACKYNHEGEPSEDNLMNFAITMYGDGAANQGQNWEAANMAQLWKLPVCYVIENNQFGMGTAINRSSANVEYYKQGGVAIPGIKADGMNVFSVREAFAFVKEYCGSGKGPIYLELDTYRFHGHSMSDPGISYRSRDEVQSMRKSRDPLELLKALMLDNELATKKEIKAMEKRVFKEVADAAERARQQPFPDDSKLIAEIYSDGKAGSSEIPDFIRMPDLHKSHGFKA